MKNTRKALSILALSLFVNFLNAFLISAEEVDKTMVTKIVEGNTSFALDLFEQIRSEEGNLFFSPYSVSTALAMTYAGARGETEKQMMKAMHIPYSQERLHTGFSQLQKSLNKVQEKGKVEILIANSLWPHVDYAFKKEYLSLLEKNYKASITTLDFANQTEKARQTINRWVEDKTKDRIKDLIKPGFLNALTRLVLANGIYFKGYWENQFKKENTRNMPFHVTLSETVNCSMMFQEGRFDYYADAEVQALEMPYEGEELSMLVLLPMKEQGLGQLEDSLNDLKLNRWISELRKINLQVFFPKFKTISEFKLSEKLKSLGMVNAFNPKQANFSGMDGTRNLYISAVIHKAFVEIDEKGTEAAAATAVGIRTTSLPTQFRADHPFIFIIRHRETGTILFMGRVMDPSANPA